MEWDQVSEACLADVRINLKNIGGSNGEIRHARFSIDMVNKQSLSTDEKIKNITEMSLSENVGGGDLEGIVGEYIPNQEGNLHNYFLIKPIDSNNKV